VVEPPRVRNRRAGRATRRARAATGRLPSFTGFDVIGRGRSGVVVRGRDGDGSELACKIFDSHGLTKLVQVVLLGAPNPYVWSEDAVRCAALRRRILAVLVAHHLPAIAVAEERGVAWNDEHRAYELATRFVDGRPARLDHPYRHGGQEDAVDEVRELVTTVMEPLQRLLVECGFDGLVWQAGHGNPVALNNFLRVEREGEPRWIWIDLESGVPALFPLDPRALLGFYLPRSLRLRRPLFDDVDVERLSAWIEEHAERYGADERARLRAAAAELAERQARWKALPRFHAAIEYRLARGQIDLETARYYRTRPLRWYARELERVVFEGPPKAARLLGRAAGRLARVRWSAVARRLVQFLLSQRFRWALARRYAERRLSAWEQRGQMSREHADRLRRHAEREESSAYLCDFGVHLGIKPFVKAIEYWVVPSLFVVGLVGKGTLALVLLAFGAFARTLYTAGRLVQSHRHGRERPWVALVVGLLPVVGNFAYPLQIVWSSSTEEDDDLARFLLYDGFSRLAAHVPIWGGRDTLTEHRGNRLAGRVIGWQRRDRVG